MGVLLEPADAVSFRGLRKKWLGCAIGTEFGEALLEQHKAGGGDRAVSEASGVEAGDCEAELKEQINSSVIR